MTTIEWTHVPDGQGGRKKGETVNPQIGCDEISPGCRNCYAAKQAARGMSGQHRGLTRSLPLLDAEGNAVFDKHGKPKIKPNSTHWNGEIRRVPKQLEKVLRWRDPRGIFWGSMTDLFIRHNLDSGAGRRFLAACLGIMGATPQHTHMVLTKRPHLMRKWFDWLDESSAEHARSITGDPRPWTCLMHARDAVSASLPGLVWPLSNVWLGTTTEDQQRADERIHELLVTPAEIRFLSCEPLLGLIMLGPDALGGYPESEEWARTGPKRPRVDWVIAGGESGPGARPMHPAWVRSLRDQCIAAGVPFFFKQWGAYVPVDDDTWTHVVTLVGRSFKRGKDTPLDVFADPNTAYMRKVSKHEGGRLLDGRTWDEFPEAA